MRSKERDYYESQYTDADLVGSVNNFYADLFIHSLSRKTEVYGIERY